MNPNKNYNYPAQYPAQGVMSVITKKYRKRMFIHLLDISKSSKLVIEESLHTWSGQCSQLYPQFLSLSFKGTLGIWKRPVSMGMGRQPPPRIAAMSHFLPGEKCLPTHNPLAMALTVDLRIKLIYHQIQRNNWEVCATVNTIPQKQYYLFRIVHHFLVSHTLHDNNYL